MRDRMILHAIITWFGDENHDLYSYCGIKNPMDSTSVKDFVTCPACNDVIKRIKNIGEKRNEILDNNN